MLKRIPFFSALIATTIGLTNGGAMADISFAADPIPEFEALAAEEDITLELLPESDEDDVDQLLINGMIVSPKKFPGVLRMTTGGTCTASLIGPATVIFAAHCLGNKNRITFRAGGKRVRGICQKAPGYNPTTHQQDWALCLLERRAIGIVFESVDIDTKPVSGDRLMLSGFGCTVEDGPLDRRLRVGFSDVVSQPANFRREPSAIFTHSAITAGEAILCPGDSGGPLFRTGDGDDPVRKIVGINSRTSYSYGVSIFSATASPEGAAFIRGWSEVNNQEICGVNLDIGCM